ADPSGLFLSGQREAVPGTCVTITLDGRRPMPVEIQALTTHQVAPNPRRTTAGVDSARVSMTLAVLHGRLGVDTGARDVYVATVGGARDRKSTRLNSSHVSISYAVFCLKKKK